MVIFDGQNFLNQAQASTSCDLSSQGLIVHVILQKVSKKESTGYSIYFGALVKVAYIGRFEKNGDESEKKRKFITSELSLTK